MKKSFTLKKADFRMENDVSILSFADSLEDVPENYVILSRANFQKDDKDFGPYIECSFGVNGYDLIESVSVKEDKIVISISNETAIEIEIILDVAGRNDVNEPLEMILRKP